MKAWYIDDDCRCTLQILRELGVMYWYIPLDSAETSAELMGQIKKDRSYGSEDEVEYSTLAMGALGLAALFREHSVGHEVAQVVVDGEAWVDVRDGAADAWVRLHVTKGDCFVLPAGLQRRVSLVPATQRFVARRLFQGAPKWEAVLRFPASKDQAESSAPAYGPESLCGESDPRAVIPKVCAQFYRLGWVSGTGGGMAIKHGARYFMAPSGVMKEALTPEMMYVLDSAGTVLAAPKQHAAQPPLKLSECAPLFVHAFELRGAGAVLHSHSLNVVMATLLDEGADEFVVTHQEMIKGIAGHRFDEPLVVPIIENTPRESNLADLLAAAIKAYPKSPAVMVRRHGIYVWGHTWKHAKTQAECLDYLCGWAVEMKKAGLNPAQNPFTDPAKSGKIAAWRMDPAQEAAGVDCRQPHKHLPSQPVAKAQLEALGVLQWKLDADKHESDPVLAELRQQRGYSYHDLITVSPDRLPNYEAKIKSFFEEHLHTDEEIRYVLDGSGYFDVRAACDAAWVRIHLKKGDLITLPAGIYHRFTLDTRQYIKALRLFVGEPVWTAYGRSPAVDAMPARAEYTAAFPVVGGGAAAAAVAVAAASEGLKKRSASAAGLGGGGPGGMPSIGDYAPSPSAAAAAAGGSASAALSQSEKRARPVVASKTYAAVILDIEGTTTPIAFVKDKLFPYAGASVAAFLDQEWDTPLVRADVALLRAQASVDRTDAALLASLPGFVDVSTEVTEAAGGPAANKAANVAALVANVQWQIGHNRKTGALKTLQGHLWKSGYECGALQGEMYPDVAPALTKWQAAKVPVYVYSSGSRQAQRLIFGHSDRGDLRPLLAGYFDTNVGGKMEPASYHQILETIGVENASKVLFATDLLGEAEAATAAGLDAVLLLRPGNAPLPPHGFATAQSFAELFPSDGQ